METMIFSLIVLFLGLFATLLTIAHLQVIRCRLRCCNQIINVTKRPYVEKKFSHGSNICKTKKRPPEMYLTNFLVYQCNGDMNDVAKATGRVHINP